MEDVGTVVGDSIEMVGRSGAGFMWLRIQKRGGLFCTW